MAAGEVQPSFMIGGSRFAATPLEPALYVVATPIGNLRDITLRALETIAAADILACEDTRVTRTLLDRYGIRRRPVAYHEHNAAEVGEKLLAALEEGRSIALISDAGTPLISDPGYRLVSDARSAGFRVVPVPGPVAGIAALVASGLPTDSFFFAGFLPTRSGQRRERLSMLAHVPATLVFYESPSRLADSLAAMAETLGNRTAAICRELTKAFEEVQNGPLSELAEIYRETGAPKGEIVVCVAPPEPAEIRGSAEIDALLAELANTLPAARAAVEAARMTGRPKAELYQRLLALKQSEHG